MKKIYCIIVLLVINMAILNVCYAQIIQHGIVKEYCETSPKINLGGVEIVVNKAGSTLSQNDGQFSLSFQTMKVGDKVLVQRIEKLGYEIFNKEALEQWYISKDNRPFIITMCRSDRFKKIRDNYERISSESYARQYKKEEAELLKMYQNKKLSQAEYEKKVEELINNYDNQLEYLDIYIDRVSRIDLSEITKEEQQIIELIQLGNIDGAIQLYDKMNLEEKLLNTTDGIKELETNINLLEKIKTQQREEQESTYAMICRKNDVLYLAGGTENFKKILSSKRNVALADTTFVKAVKDYAYFLQNIHEYEEAKRMLQIAYNNGKVNEERIELQLSMAANAVGMGKYELAESMIGEINEVIEEEFKEDLITKMVLLKSSLNLLGLTLSLEGRYSDARQCFELIAEFLNEFSAGMPNLVEKKEQVSISIQIVQTYIQQGNYGDAEKLLQEMLQVVQSLYSGDPDKYGRELAVSYHLLASCKYQTLQLNEAEEYARKAVSLLEKICIKYGDLYVGELADYQSLLAGILRSKGDKQTAIVWYEKARRNYEGKVTSQLYERGVFKCDVGIGASLVDLEKYNEAKPILIDALKYFMGLTIHTPTVDALYLNCLISLANAYQYTNDFVVAEKYENEALSIAEKYYVQYPAKFANMYALLHYNMGYRLLVTGKLDKAEACLKKAIEITQKKEVPFYDREEYMPYALAYIYNQQGKADLAEKMIDMSLEINPKNLMSLDAKGELLMKRGKKKQAQQIWLQILNLDSNWAVKGSDFSKMMMEK